MKLGKLPENCLKRSVIKEMKYSGSEIPSGAGIGRDCAIFSFSEGSGNSFTEIKQSSEDAEPANCVTTKAVSAAEPEKEAISEPAICMTTNVVTEDIPEKGLLAIHTAVNNLAAAGAKPVAAEAAILFPGQNNEEELKLLMRQLDRTCEKLRIPLVGGHTEITRAVRYPVITVTGIGQKTNLWQSSSNNSPKDYYNLDVVVTKWVGLAGTFLIARRKEEELLKRFPDNLIDEAKAFDKFLSVVPEAATAGKSNVKAMHDISKGGVLGALWEMAQRFGVGLKIDLKKIPIRQETVEICNFFDINPYELLSTGSLLLFAENGKQLVQQLAKEGIMAAVVGQTTEGNDRLIQVEEEIRYLTRPGTDELVRFLNAE